MTNAYFDNIREQIISEIDKAKKKILVAVYCFTNETLFHKLLSKLSQGIEVELIIHNNYINNRDTGLNFQQFINDGGKFFFSNSKNPMHNKFCILDDSTLINGSYNWTYYAENRNRENIVVTKEDKEIITSFTNEFQRLKSLTEEISEIRKLKREEINESDLLNIKYYLGQDLICMAKETGRMELVDTAFEISRNNIDVQKTAFDLGLTQKFRLKQSIGASLVNDGYLILIPKNTLIPHIQRHRVTTVEDNQTSISSTIYYGENSKASRNREIFKMEINRIPPKPAGKSDIEYYCSIDLAGKLRIKKYSLDTGRGYYNEKDLSKSDLLENVEVQ